MVDSYEPQPTSAIAVLLQNRIVFYQYVIYLQEKHSKSNFVLSIWNIFARKPQKEPIFEERNSDDSQNSNKKM